MKGQKIVVWVDPQQMEKDENIAFLGDTVVYEKKSIFACCSCCTSCSFCSFFKKEPEREALRRVRPVIFTIQ